MTENPSQRKSTFQNSQQEPTKWEIEKFKETVFLNSLVRKAYQRGAPINATFELTPRCNFNCQMCYVHLSESEIPLHGRELTAAEWIHLAELARDMGVLSLVLTGGEPMLHPGFAEIYEAIARMGFLITLQTNCSLMTDKAMALFDRLPPREIKTTLYGASDETYEKVCGAKNGLTRALDGMRRVREAGIPLTVVATAVKDNWAEMEQVYALAAGMGIRLMHTNRLLPHTRKPSGAPDGIVRFADLTESEKDAVAQRRDEMRALRQGAPAPRFTSPLQKCKVYRTGFWVLWDGRMSLCAHLLEPTYSLLDMDMKTAWALLIAELARLYPEQACAACPQNTACGQCPATVQTREPFIYSALCEERTREKRMLIDGGGMSLPCD